MPSSHVLQTFFAEIGVPAHTVTQVGPTEEQRRGYALAELAVRVAEGWATRHLSVAHAATLAVLEEVVDEATAEAANRALRAVPHFLHQAPVRFAACATAAATTIHLPAMGNHIDVAFYAGRTVQEADGRALALELAARIQ